ncbi:D-threo-3-hydroxyaspartate dehydratase [Diplonema papillatum]|nr:D-threo-3-hydroxyaspartate dehydratase [Diplonema papillatum]
MRPLTATLRSITGTYGSLQARCSEPGFLIYRLSQYPGQTTGLVTHAGEAYHCRSAAECEAFAEKERAAVAGTAEFLQKNGVSCSIVSAGSTPTAAHAQSADGLTELRAGVYVFGDLMMAAVGACSLQDVALSVLATVITHKVHHDGSSVVIVDAGRLALSADPGFSASAGTPSFGLVCDAATTQPYLGLCVASTNQEHGMIPLQDTEFTLEDFPVGKRVRILPNHACITAAAYSGYQVVDKEGNVVDYWDRFNGW